MQQRRLTSEQWSEYWKRDSVTTFARQFDSNYDAEFAAFWDSVFERVGDGSSIVDLATGNGAVAFLAAQFGRRCGRRFRIRGIDYAEIDPATVLANNPHVAPLLSDVDFHGRVRIEKTGLADDCIDLLTSQYGFEYANRTEAVAEARRVLKRGALIALIMHHEKSEIIKLAADGLKQARYCIRDERLDARVIALVRAMGNATTLAERRRLSKNERTESLRKKLNAAVARVNARATRYGDPEGFIGVIVPNLLNVFLQYKDAPPGEKLSYLRRVREDILSFEKRMVDLQQAALSESQFRALVEELRVSGFRVCDEKALHYGPNRHLMGWQLIAEKT